MILRIFDNFEIRNLLNHNYQISILLANILRFSKIIS